MPDLRGERDNSLRCGAAQLMVKRWIEPTCNEAQPHQPPIIPTAKVMAHHQRSDLIATIAIGLLLTAAWITIIYSLCTRTT